ncbi:MFS transporter [Streptomyces sp. SAJ15]|uniref:MFS transporter n=1 Tax=Streptomyces sp. SAJ15 TaxID=2011095 RepID=UPI001185AB7E|nr:MFS transporter [Streptomyces sp. SAJ15]TVL89631.1 MFS transporter [Streptomyces sp. SAJ15]
MTTRPSPPAGLALAVLLLGEFLAIFDISVVNVVLPVVQEDLRAGDAQAYLVVACYGMAYASLLVMGGRLGDRLGFRAVFLGGVALFGLASLACGLAPAAAALIVARAAQGVGAALLFPQVLAGIHQVVPAARRGAAVGAFGTVLGLGSTLGQLGGGVLTELELVSAGWRSAFLVNVPLCLAIWLAGRRVLPAGHTTARRLDLPGALLLAAAVAALVLPWSLPDRPRGPLWTVLLVLAPLAPTAALVRWERRLTRGGGTPLLHPELLRQRGFLAGLALCLVFFATQVPFYVLLSQTAQRGAGLDPLGSAGLYAGLGLAFLAASVLAGRADPRHTALLTAGGPLLMAVGYLGLRSVPAHALHPGSLSVTALLVVNGAGAGLVAPTVIRFVLAGVDTSLTGVASGLLATAQQLANSVGVVVAGAVFRGAGHHGQVLAGFRAALLYFTVLAAAAVALSRLVARGHRPPAKGAQPPREVRSADA